MSDRLKRATALTEPLYLRSRRAALALGFALMQDAKAAYEISRDAFVHLGRRAARKAPEAENLLSRVYQKAKPPRRKGEQQPEAPLSRLSGLQKQQRAAWALCRVCGLAPEAAGQALKLDGVQLKAALEAADQALDDTDAAAFSALLDRMENRREIWGEITFRLERHFRASRSVRTALLSGLAIVLCLLVLREGQLALRVLAFPGREQADVISRSYDDAAFYRRYPPRENAALPGIEKRLYDELLALPAGQKVRAAFLFYDARLMEGIREDGRNLLELYQELFDLGYDRGQVHALLARAIERYFSSYERPFQVRLRKADFVPQDASLYHSALAVAEGSGYSETVKRHPEIFGDEESLKAYFRTPAFQRELPDAKRLCYIYSAVREAELAGQQVEKELRERYEDLIFAFTNPNGLAGRLAPALFSYTKEETDAFFPVRARLGEALYGQTLALVNTLLPGAQVSSDILEGNESSLFSATLSREELFRLARDDRRFQFIGIAAPFLDSGLPGLEHGLADLIAKDKAERHEVYQIDREYLLYSVNYAAPLTLPAGFIAQLRETIPCRDTLFEQLIAYSYQMRFAHPRTLPGWRILRDSYRNEALQFSLRQYKNFSKMDRY